MPTRRTLLGGAVVVPLTGVLAGCGALPPSPPRPRPRCVARAELVRHDELAGVPIVYEENGRAQGFWLAPGFAARLTRWLEWWQQHSPAGAPDEIWSYGSWVDGGSDCSSWHHAGRAFDVTSLRRDGRVTFSARIDRVEALPSAEQPAARRRYWQLAAGLHLFFADVLTHRFDDAHRNHIHVDDGRLPAEGTYSVFTGGSGVQVQAVLAISQHVLSSGSEGEGDAAAGRRWDASSRRTVAAAAEPLGLDPDLTDPAAWQAFLTAAVERD